MFTYIDPTERGIKQRACMKSVEHKPRLHGIRPRSGPCGILNFSSHINARPICTILDRIRSREDGIQLSSNN